MHWQANSPECSIWQLCRQRSGFSGFLPAGCFERIQNPNLLFWRHSSLSFRHGARHPRHV